MFWKILLIISAQCVYVHGITGKFEAVISFDVEGSLKVSESEGVHYIPLKRSGIYKDITVTVQYQLIQGSATPGVDYVQNEGKIVFQPNQMDGKIPLKLIQDEGLGPQDQEDPYMMILITSDDATMGENNPLLVTIHDDLEHVPVAAGQNQVINIEWSP